MHIYFSGIGGAGANSLALLAAQAGYEVSGSDAKDSSTISYLKKHGVESIHIGQTEQEIEKIHGAKPIGAFVYTSALPMTDPNHPELMFCQKNNIPTLKHDEFLARFINEQRLELIAIAGTHGKSTTAAMAVWLVNELGIPASWSVGAKMTFADTGHFEPGSRYFICEADEFDRKFLNLYPKLALISGLDWDHPDIYPTRESYLEAFGEFIDQSEKTAIWQDDADQLGLEADSNLMVLDPGDTRIDQGLALPGRVNRQDAWLAIEGLAGPLGFDMHKALNIMNKFPGVLRRFERITENIYSDYAHTPPKIRGALQLAHEVAGKNVVVVYEGLHNTRQHFIKDELASLFDDVKELYIVPSYLAREDKSLKLLEPKDLIVLLSDNSAGHAQPAELNAQLKTAISDHAKSGDLVLCLSAGGVDSLDEWLRKEFKS